MNSNVTKTKTNRGQKRRSFRCGLSRLFFLSGASPEDVHPKPWGTFFRFFDEQNFYFTSCAWLSSDKIIMLRAAVARKRTVKEGSNVPKFLIEILFRDQGSCSLWTFLQCFGAQGESRNFTMNQWYLIWYGKPATALHYSYSDKPYTC